MKAFEAQKELAAKAQRLCSDWPAGEARGLHPTMHKSYHESWNAAVALGFLVRGNVDQGGYTRYTRTDKPTE